MEGVTVREAYNVLKDEGIYWMAGQRGENRLIESVSVLEIPDCYEWLCGGEMILTTFYTCRNDEERLKLLEGLERGGAACIMLHPGSGKLSINLELLMRFADEINFPLFIIDRKVPYSIIIKKVYELLLSKKEQELKRAQEINDTMNNILLSNGGASEIIEKLSSITNKTVLFLDEDFVLIEAVFRNSDKSSLEKKIDKILDWAKNLVENMPESGNLKFKVASYDEDHDVALVPVESGGENHYLLIIKRGKLSEYERKLFEVALPGTIMALKMDIMKNRAILETEQRLKSDFFDDVINGRYISGELMNKRAKTLGLNLFDKNFVIIVDIDDFEKYYRENYEKGEEHIQKVKMDLKKAVQEASRNSKVKNKIVLFVQQSDACVLVAGFTQREYLTDRHKRELGDFFRKIFEGFSSKYPTISLTIGISSLIENLTELKRAYAEALFAKDVGAKLFGKGKIHYYDDLGIYKFITIPERKEDVFKDKCLQKLYDYDESKNASLISTLEAFLDSNCSVKETAKRLFAHPNTVKYRLKKIKEIMGENVLEDPQMRLYYHLLVKVMKMLP
ncbi:purine catabolism regulatory protein [Caldanaerovirga acetigignens]|uniref:Purine catabolism regulatory protein n=1 Tax=Caldanaerovirga acetigignens TaxID=447595 RepID=A0A1M7M7J1_9FIRM|nr:PucR family transcriptional regulator [Caldanaerovirga acetigignens]SHM86701.1 purine catabolism regulatory protein [Caldanaerovirga acetigignens]